MNSIHKLLGKKALVTGASKGIGSAIAIRLAEAGADIVVNYNSDSAGAELTGRTITDLGCKALIIKADVGNPEQVKQMFEGIRKEWGAIDILVNNAGVSPKKPFLSYTVEEIQKVISTNLTGTILCAREALLDMTAGRNGRIINISSGHSAATNGKLAPYAASKGGIDAFTRALAVEYGPFGICVNSLIVGAITNERTLQLPYSSEQMDEWKKCIPVGRWGTPEEIAEAVLFLSFPASGFINGACISIDGGQLCNLAHP